VLIEGGDRYTSFKRIVEREDIIWKTVGGWLGERGRLSDSGLGGKERGFARKTVVPIQTASLEG